MTFLPHYAHWNNHSKCPFPCSRIGAKKLGQTLNVMYCSKGAPNTYTPDEDGEKITIAIKVSDIFEQSGELYPDESTFADQPCFIATIPNGKIACKIISESEEKLAQLDSVK